MIQWDYGIMGEVRLAEIIPAGAKEKGVCIIPCGRILLK